MDIDHLKTKMKKYILFIRNKGLDYKAETIGIDQSQTQIFFKKIFS